MEFGHSALPQEFWEKVRVRDDGCWEWIGYINRSGYGSFRGRGVHRFVMEVLEGVSIDMVVDHACHNRETCQRRGRSLGAECPHRRCCNPAHLEVVTQWENLKRSAAWTTERRMPYPDLTKRCRSDRRRVRLHPLMPHAGEGGDIPFDMDSAYDELDAVVDSLLLAHNLKWNKGTS